MQEIKIGDITVRSLPEAQSYEAQGFISGPELKQVESKFREHQEQSPKPRLLRQVEKLIERLRTH